MSKNTLSTKGGAMAADGHKTRRAALGALAGASALAIPAISASASALPDPIFTAIERHKAACNALDATRFAMDDIINTRETSQAEWDAYDRAHENEDAAFQGLLTDAPKTAAGTRAIIAHVISIDDGRLSQKMRQLLALLLRSPAFKGLRTSA
jgi:hypothetical protein